MPVLLRRMRNSVALTQNAGLEPYRSFLPDRLKQGVARKKQRAGEAVRFLFLNFVVLIHHHVPVRRVKDMCRFVFKDDAQSTGAWGQSAVFPPFRMLPL